MRQMRAKKGSNRLSGINALDLNGKSSKVSSYYKWRKFNKYSIIVNPCQWMLDSYWEQYLKKAPICPK